MGGQVFARIGAASCLAWGLTACSNLRPDGAPYAKAACEYGEDLSPTECATLREMALPERLPPADGNRVGDDPDAARLGFLIFFDRRFSNVPGVSCATCHQPEHAFTDGKPVPEVVSGRPLARNSLTILNAAWMRPHYFWDGRADSLWSQPLFAFEHPDEMASSRTELAHAIFATSAYRDRYEEVFGPLPDLSDSGTFPRRGKPGDPSFDRMSRDEREAIDGVFANVGKALEAYMRKVAAGPSKLDRYLRGERQALDSGEVTGLRVFLRKGCPRCHSGSTLSDNAFHKMYEGGADRGRALGIEVLRTNRFNARGPFFDRGFGHAVPPVAPPTARDESAFRTPSLRNVALTAPYGHDGRFATLADAMRAHPVDLSDEDVGSLVVFLLALNGAYPDRPWSDWPAR